MASRNFLEPHWVRYEMTHLLEQHISAWEAFCRERERLVKQKFWDSPSELHRANHGRPRLETTGRLLDMALKAVGPVEFEGRLYETSDTVAMDPKDAPPGTQGARGLFVEIISPMNGMARKAK